MSTIHYCWFGTALPEEIADRTHRWLFTNPGWQLKEWSRLPNDSSRCQYVCESYAHGDWAYCSDYVRLKALYDYGGVYLDTDVEVFKSFDRLMDGNLHVGYMHNCALGTAVLASPPRHPVIRDLLVFYEQLNGVKALNNNAVFTEYFLQQVPNFKLNGHKWSSKGICIHPKTFFEQPSFLGGGFSVHLFDCSWDTKRTRKKTYQPAKPSALFTLKRMLRSLLEESRCVYFPFYLRDRYRIPSRVPPLPLRFETFTG
jgi:hypothetical protein